MKVKGFGFRVYTVGLRGLEFRGLRFRGLKFRKSFGTSGAGLTAWSFEIFRACPLNVSSGLGCRPDMQGFSFVVVLAVSRFI